MASPRKIASRAGFFRHVNKLKKEKMKTPIFTNLDEIFVAAGTHQVTAQEVLNRRSYVFGEWQEISITDDLKNEIIEEIVQTAGGRNATKNSARYCLRYERPRHWALDRFLLSKYGENTARFSYCAGQDMTWEMSNLRKYLGR